MCPLNKLLAASLAVSVVSAVGCGAKGSAPSPGPKTTLPPVQAPKTQAGDIPERAFQLRELKQATVKVGGRPFRVWLMDSDLKREEGFMWVRDSQVKADEGMLFVFFDAKPRGFWMQNCYMGLDIAYFGADRRLLNVVNGKPGDETNLPSSGPAKYVLEVKAGTLAKLGVRRGAKLEVPPTVVPLQ